MSNTEKMVVTLTPMVDPSVFPSTDLVRVLHSGGAASVSHDHQQDPRRTGDGQIFDWNDLGHTGTWPVPAPLVFLGAWSHLEGVFTARHRDLVETRADNTIAFDAAQNKLTTTTPSGFDKFSPYVGQTLVIAGSSVAGNNTGFDNVSRILGVTSTEIQLDPELHPLANAPAGDLISLSVGYSLKEGDEPPRFYAAEEGYLSEIVAGDRRLEGNTFSARTDVQADATTNRLIAPEGTFASFQPFVGSSLPVSILGFSQPGNRTPAVSPARIVSLTTNGGNDELELSGIALETEAAGNPVSVWLGGSFAQLIRLLVESFEVSTQGGGAVDTTANYQVGEVLGVMTHRSLGSGTYLPHTGAAMPQVLSKHTEANFLGGISFRAERMKSASWKYENGLQYDTPDGAGGRKDPQFGKFMCSGSFEVNHDAAMIHPLYEKQMAHEPIGMYRRFLDRLGNRIVFGIPSLYLKDGIVDKSGERANFKPSFNAKTDPLLRATSFVQWIPAF